MATDQKLDCVFCKEIFEDKEALQIHFRRHGDPNFHKNKMRSPNETPSNEMSAEENELVGCDVCEEVFPTISKAITHKHKAHPDHDAKYFCPYCGKLFTMKHLYNKHIQSNHEGGQVINTKEFRCDCCNVNFYVPSAMVYHNKFFHRQDTELPGVGQSKKVKTCHQEMLQIYYCSFCGEEYNNKVNLHKHMCDDHGDENQSPSEILRCPLCEAIFYHLDAYEVHLTFHSTDDMYSEKNEMVEEVTEFSLETVAPIMEKVEEEVPEQTDDGTMNSDCIDNFLQLVMGESADNDAPERVKSKKHKKHKKSKKAAITLDEFLNMNKDVFGDGLDVQGIEEVPTQVVLNKSKGKKLPAKNDSKIVDDLAKLKKQGIVIKTKSGKRPVASHFNKNSKNILVSNTNVTNNPNEILSKLLNQGNSQIKIVKKSVVPTSIPESDLKTDNFNELNESMEEHTSDNEKNDKNTANIDQMPNENSHENSHNENQTNNNDLIINEESSEKSLTNNDILGDANDSLQVNKLCITTKDSKITSAPESELKTKISNTYSQNQNDPKGILSNKSIDISNKDLLDNYNMQDKKVTCSNPGDNVDDESVCTNQTDKDNIVANKTLDALKHLSHLITIKSVNQPKNPDKSNTNNETFNEESKPADTVQDEQNESKHSYMEQVPTNAGLKTGNDHLMKNPTNPIFENAHSDYESGGEFNVENENNSNTEFEKLDEIDSNIKQVKLKIRNIPPTQGKMLIKKSNIKSERNETDDEDELRNEEFSKKTTNIDILKRLTNVTAKSIPGTSNNNQIPNIKINRPVLNQVREMLPKNLIKHPINKEVEIFNIDDSDSDGSEQLVLNSKIEEKESNNALDVLRNVSKNMTVKSSQQNINVTEVKGKKIENKTLRSDTSTEKHFTFSKHSTEIQKSINLQNKLKNLGGNITVKSRNLSPNVLNKEFETYDDYDDEFDSGSEMNVGKVKITELNEDDMSGNECWDNQTNAIVKSPNASNSDDEFKNDTIDNEFADFEDKIKSTKLQKQDEPTTSKKPAPCLENFKNLNKNLIIKSLNAKKNDSEDESNTDVQKDFCKDKHNLNKQVAIKQFKPNTPQNVQPTNRPIINQSSVCTNQTMNKNVSTSSNQVNTVKTVKKIQSKTVIEEITTTVTKTIRTVNQSSSEVLQNNARCGPRPVVRPQKILNRPIKELHGTAIRHSSPTIGTRIRNATSIVRHPNPSIIRPSNQIVPVRPVLNAQRNPTPSTSAIRKTVPSRGSSQKPTIGKLKISPHALNQTIKRSSEDTSGHFSCFKKPKESLMPSSDMDSDDDSTMQYTSASHSQSNFSSVTKTVKGMGMVTATQMRSEVNTSSQQQLSKLSNVSGLKIVKSSSKQAMQVEEKCEVNTAKKNTLDALEKLQKHGLLVKKPRIDDYNEPDYQSESDEDTSEK